MKKLGILCMSMLFALTFVVTASAQKIKVTGKGASELKGEAKVKISFTYDKLKVGKLTEAAYIKKKREEATKDSKSPDQWEESWNNDRSSVYENKFETLFNKEMEEAGFVIGATKDFDESKYTMIVNTDFIEPGFNVGVMRKPALINLSVVVVETASPDKVLFKATIMKSPGRDVMGFDYASSGRIGEAYAKAGKAFAKFLYKKHLKK